MDISVVICTHNPKKHYFERVLNSLANQSLCKSKWELLLIDNASNILLQNQWDISWHPNGRHVREEQLGLTHARLRAIRESSGSNIVFVDDDNLLAAHYLENALSIADNWKCLGAWGGKMTPEFEVNPSAEVMPLIGFLALNNHWLKVPIWSNAPLQNNHALPCGAGMCVRSRVARAYADLVSNDIRRQGLDRTGTSLLSAGDTDMALVSCDLGLGTGIFPDLELTHLIPKNRIEPEYLLRLYQSIKVSLLLLNAIRGQDLPEESISLRIFKKYQILRSKGLNKSLLIADAMARKTAIEHWKNMEKRTPEFAFRPNN